MKNNYKLEDRSRISMFIQRIRKIRKSFEAKTIFEIRILVKRRRWRGRRRLPAADPKFGRRKGSELLDKAKMEKWTQNEAQSAT